MDSAKTILFLCTGNYYRSRYAEALFNHRAPLAGLRGFVAQSRGLAIEFSNLVGPVSVHTREAATRQGVPLDERAPRTLTYGDLRAAHLVIAVKEAEHRPMIDRSFPGWSNRVVFWHVHDIDVALPDVALVEIEGHVDRLIAQLKAMK
jgi:protein-tyrosine-phosphatase